MKNCFKDWSQSTNLYEVVGILAATNLRQQVCSDEKFQVMNMFFYVCLISIMIYLKMCCMMRLKQGYLEDNFSV